MILLAIIIVFIVLCIISFSFDKREDEIKLLRNYLSDKASEVDTLTKTIMGLNQDLSEKEAYIADIQDIVSNLRIKATRLEGVTAERDRFKQENITLRLWAEKELSRKDEAIREFEQKYADIEREEISKRKDTEKRCQLLDLENEKLRKKLSDKIEVLRQSLQIIHEMQNDLAQGYPSVIEALDMYAEILDRQIADSLIHKVTPAPRAADIVKEETARRREAEKRCRLLGFENDQLRQKIEAPSSEVGLRPETELVSNEEIISTLTQKLSEKTEELQQALQVIYELKTDLAHGFPTLVETLDAYAVLLDSRTVDNLINKSTSAPKSADVVREETLKRRDAEKRCRLLGFENDQLRRKLETLTGEAESRREAEKQNSILRAENSKLRASV